MTVPDSSEPTVSADLLDRILLKLGLSEMPDLGLAGLNRTYAAFSANVPNDNIQKRIWFANGQHGPVTGGDPIGFFENWLAHGTGGTCFPANGGLYALLCALGFDAIRISGSVIMEGVEPEGNHGSVVVNLGGFDYLADAQLGAFKVLPLVPGEPSSTGDRIHDIRAVPIAGGFDVKWWPGSNRQDPVTMRPDLEKGPVDHQYFLTQYDLSASRERRRSPFNDALFVSRHFPESILIVARGNRMKISSDNKVTKTAISDSDCTQALIEEFGISEEVAHAIPPDEV